MKDIGADDLVPMQILEKDSNGDPIVRLTEKKPAEEDIVRKIISDINDDTFDVSGVDVEAVKAELDSDDEGKTPELDKAIDFYKENNMVDKIIVEKQVFRKNKDFDNAIKKANRMVPFIMASGQKSKDAEIKDKNGNIVYVAPSGDERKKLYETGDVTGYDCIVTTYSQFAPGTGYAKRMEFLYKALNGKKPFLIFDESHKASGSSGTGETATDLIEKSQGRAVFLSATYAKRPDNMPLYAASTSIQDANLDKDSLINAFNTFGVPLQEAVSASLVREGEYVRRQRTYEGIDVDYLIMDEQMANIGFNRKEEHFVLANQTTTVIRELINFQREYVDTWIKESKRRAKQNNRELGISKAPAFSGVFNTINQLLLCVKAPDVADYTISLLKSGKKTIIALQNTMEAAADRLKRIKHPDYYGEEVVDLSFKGLLYSKFKDVLSYNELDAQSGKKQRVEITLSELSSMHGDVVYARYDAIVNLIENISAPVIATPIDVLKKRIEEAGFSFYEVTGRTTEVEILDATTGILKTRKKRPITDVVRQYQENKLDCLLINVSGSTGLSAHSVLAGQVDRIKTNKGFVKALKELSKGEYPVIPNSMEPRDEVKQRVMVMLQPDLDINIEVQKRGRIFRTGQILPPAYKYITSAIPAEKRLLAMLKKKNKSLDANTSSDQKDSSDMLAAEDFLNVVGDKVLLKLVGADEKMRAILESVDMLGLAYIEGKGGSLVLREEPVENFAYRISGRVSILHTDDQEYFYNSMTDAYRQEVQTLKSTGEFNLETEVVDYKAKFLEARVLVTGKSDATTVFGRPLYIVKTEINNLNKPFTGEQLRDKMISNLTVGGTILSPDEHKDHLIAQFDAWIKGYRVSETALNIESANIWKKKQTESVKEKYKENKEKLEQKLTEIEEQYQERLNKDAEYVEDYIQRRETEMYDLFTNFKVGKAISYPVVINNVAGEQLPSYKDAVIYEIKVDTREKYPYTPSRVIIGLAFSSGIKSMPVSYLTIRERRNFIRPMASFSPDSIVSSWNSLTKESAIDRKIAYIAMGNLLLIGQVAEGAKEDEKSKSVKKSEWIKKMVEFTDFEDSAKIYKGIQIDGFSFEGTGGTYTVAFDEGRSVIMRVLSEKHKELPTTFGSLTRDFSSKIIIRTSSEEIFANEFIKSMVEGGTFKKKGAEFTGVVQDGYENQLFEIFTSLNMKAFVGNQDITNSGMSVGIDIETVLGFENDLAEEMLKEAIAKDQNLYAEKRDQAEEQRKINENMAAETQKIVERMENKLYRLIALLK
jgi:hypothetical protein